MVRSFLAFTLPSNIKSFIKEIQVQTNKHNIGKINFVPAANLHMTLIFLGDMPEVDLGLLTKKILLSKLSFKDIQFRCTCIDYFGSKKTPTVLYLGFDDVEGHGQNLFRKLSASINFKTDKSWMPHVTIGRFRKSEAYSGLYKIKQELTADIEFSPQNLTLFSSTLLADGPRYKIIHQF